MLRNCMICRAPFESPYRKVFDSMIVHVCSGYCYAQWIYSSDYVVQRPGTPFPAEKRKGFRSKLEARYAQWLLAYAFRFSYEPYSFVLRKNLWYVPDFCIHSGTFVEVKGLWNARDKSKIREFVKTGNHIHIADAPFVRLITRGMTRG